MKDLQDDVIFTASLDGIKLSTDQIKRIDNGIKNVIMTELAQIDHGGDIVINKKIALNPKLKGFNDLFKYGIWLEDFDRFRSRIQKF
ncbi:hypothetical protein I2486_04140 [Cellulophaga sp. E16_2]|uniref:hypothetical protein n=1 Tax=unclassified Cellulophaga TaxID=2634405 RepID=UPI0013FD1B0C|nr:MULTISPECIES: hypothetical protein [unclassified Cellulophaga]MBO0590589.1 hypothetical protein [Cellulophaga sp. E16_2]